MLTQQNGRLPIVPQFLLTQVMHRVNIKLLPGICVGSVIITKLRAGIGSFIISCIYLHLHTIASTYGFPPIFIRLRLFFFFSKRETIFTHIQFGRPHPNTIILQAAIHIIRSGIICSNTIKLTHSITRSFKPFIAIIVGNIYTPIITGNPMVILVGIHPAAMPIAVGVIFINTCKCFSTIRTQENTCTKSDNFILIYRRYKYFTKIITVAAVYPYSFCIYFFPASSCIITPVNLTALNTYILKTIICYQPIVNYIRR